MAKENEQEKPKEVEKATPDQKEIVEVVEVPTQMGFGFKLPTGEIVDELGYLQWLGNLVYKLSKAI